MVATSGRPIGVTFPPKNAFVWLRFRGVRWTVVEVIYRSTSLGVFGIQLASCVIGDIG